MWYVAVYTAVGTAGVVINIIRGGGVPVRWFIGVPVFYFVSGVSAGAIVGLLRPLTTSLIGSIVTGIVAVVPISATMLLLLLRGYLPDGWTGRHTIIFVVGFSAIFGTAGGVIFKRTP